jgi:rhamnogalacturonan endolyase
MMADIDPRHRGAEAWGGPGGLRNSLGQDIGPKPRSTTWAIWWDGDLLRELFGGSSVNKWNWETSAEERIFTPDGRGGGLGPNLGGDILGDWREEILVAAPDRKSLRLYTTTVPTQHRINTLMHDPQYRLSIAWQNVAYNKPPHTSYYLGDGMSAPPRADIRLIGKGEAITVGSARR